VSTQIGCNLPWESTWRCTIRGLVGKFLPVQPTMALEDAKAALWSTTWDLLLLRIRNFFCGQHSSHG